MLRFHRSHCQCSSCNCALLGRYWDRREPNESGKCVWFNLYATISWQHWKVMDNDPCRLFGEPFSICRLKYLFDHHTNHTYAWCLQGCLPEQTHVLYCNAEHILSQQLAGKAVHTVKILHKKVLSVDIMCKLFGLQIMQIADLDLDD